MTARHDLIRHLAALRYEKSTSNRLSEYRVEAWQDVQAVIDEALHEAAERIRNHTWAECCMCPNDSDPDDAADLIDPVKPVKETPAAPVEDPFRL